MKVQELRQVLEFLQDSYVPGRGVGPTVNLEELVIDLITASAGGRRQDSKPIDVITGNNAPTRKAVAYQVDGTTCIVPSPEMWGAGSEIIQDSIDFANTRIARFGKGMMGPGFDIQAAIQTEEARIKELKEKLEARTNSVSPFLDNEFWKGNESLGGFITGGKFLGLTKDGVMSAYANTGNAIVLDKIEPVDYDSAIEILADLPDPITIAYIRSHFPLEPLEIKKGVVKDTIISFTNRNITIPSRSVQLYFNNVFNGLSEISLDIDVSEDVATYLTDMITDGDTNNIGSPAFSNAHDYATLIEATEMLGIHIGATLDIHNDDTL